MGDAMMDGLVIVGLCVAMLVVLGRQAVKLRDHLYEEQRYLRERPVSDRRLKSMWLVDTDGDLQVEP